MKKSTIVKFSIVAGTLVLCGLAACSKGFQQDPYADKPKSIQDGVAPEEKRDPPQPKPLRADALRIDAQDFYSFKEGQEGEANFSGRVLSPIDGHEGKLNEDFVITVENLDQFPGATFDQATSKFTWKPPRQYVAAMDSNRNQSLVLTLTTKTAPVLQSKKTVSVFVTRSETDPEIVAVDDLTTNPIREGKRQMFKVIVKDPDAVDADITRPRLLVVASKRGVFNAAHLVYLAEPQWRESNPKQDPTDKSKWIFTMYFDASSTELTHGKENLSFGLVALTRFGRSSAPKAVEATVITKVEQPVLSVGKSIRVVAGQENLVNFTVFDPQNEGQLSVFLNRCDLLPGAPSCVCAAQEGNESVQLCTISWKVPEGTPASTLKISGEALNRSKVPGDAAELKQLKFDLTVKVISATGEVPPDPTPAPSPTPAPAAVPLDGGP